MSTDPTIKNSTYNQLNGRYTRGGTTEVSDRFIEWWERHDFQYDISDLVYVLEEKYVGRPDLLAFAFYGDTRLKWVIMQYNDILDPAEELVAGKLLLMPSLEKVADTFKVSTVGGVPSTAEGT